MMVTVFLLVFAFLVSAVSGVYELQRFGQLAEDVSRRTTEIPYPHKLNALAAAMKDHAITEGFRSNPEMIETTFQSPSRNRSDDVGYIDYVISDFEVTLIRYDTEIAKRSAMTDVSDDEKQRSALQKIQSQFKEAKLACRRLGLQTRGERIWELKKLCVLTNAHLDEMQHGIERFRAEVQGQYQTSKYVVCGGVAFVILLLVMLWWIFHSSVAKPFNNLLTGCRLVAEGQLEHRIDLGTKDELSELGEAMNLMSERFMDSIRREQAMNRTLDRQVKDRSREVIRNEQLASVGFLAAGVAHEINNPLQGISLSARILKRQISSLVKSHSNVDQELYEDAIQNLRIVEDEAFRCSDITTRLLDFSRLGDMKRTNTNLGDLVNGVVDLVRKVGKFRCKTIETHCSIQVSAHINSHEIQQVVLNLVANALESVETDGRVDVYIDSFQGQARVVVEDNGCGMTSEIIDHLFEPFFTRRRDGTGTGLGLSISYRIVSQHHGSLTAQSDGEGKGSRMELLLPTVACSNDSTTIINHENDHASQAA